MPAAKLMEFLEHEKAHYVTIPHSPAFTSQEIAAIAHVPGKDLAKTVVIYLDDRMAMAVLPANQKVVMSKLREAVGATRARFATEEEFKDAFPDCEPGAMPPFGNLYGMDVYVAEPLAEDEEIAFNAGEHTELLRMPYRDFNRLVRPKVADFTI